MVLSVLVHISISSILGERLEQESSENVYTYSCIVGTHCTFILMRTIRIVKNNYLTVPYSRHGPKVVTFYFTSTISVFVIKNFKKGHDFKGKYILYVIIINLQPYITNVLVVDAHIRLFHYLHLR